MAVPIYQQIVRACGQITVTGDSTVGRMLLNPPKAVPVLSPGIEEQVTMAMTDGIMKSRNQYRVSEQPTIQLTFDRKPSPGLLSLTSGYKHELAWVNQTVSKRIKARSAAIDGAASGEEGFGVVEDVSGAQLFRLNDDGTLTEYTQVDFLNTPSGDEFAVGENAALKIPEADIGALFEYVIPVGSGDTQIIQTGDTKIGEVGLLVPLFTDQDQVIVLQVDRAKYTFDAPVLDSADSDAALTFNILTEEGLCEPGYRIYIKPRTQRQRC